MAKRKTLTPAERIAARRAELEALLEQNEHETRDAQRAVEADPASPALGQLIDLKQERTRLVAMLDALGRVAGQKAVEESAAERRERVKQLEAQIDAALANRATAAKDIASAVEALTGALARYSTVAEDLSGAVGALHRLAGRRSLHFPDTRATSTENSLLDALYRSGLGRTGPRLSGRVSVERGFVSCRHSARPVDEAHERDAAKLREAVTNIARIALPESDSTEAAA